MSAALDAVTGLPLDDSYLTQYQIPLGSQPINLEELGALGRQPNWLYPDNLPGVVSRLQARDTTNPLNAQDLSTDGKRNLNVNIARSAIPGGSGGLSPKDIQGPSGAASQVLPSGDTTEVMTIPVGGPKGLVITGVYGFVVCPAASVSFDTDLIIQYSIAHDGYTTVNGFAVLQAISASFYGVQWSDQFTVPILFSDITDTVHGYIEIGVGGNMTGTMGMTWYDANT